MVHLSRICWLLWLRRSDDLKECSCGQVLIISLTLWAYSSDTCWARKTSACAGLVLTPSTAFTAIQFLKTMQVILPLPTAVLTLLRSCLLPKAC